MVVYDALVGDQVLELVRPDCRLEYAGKRGGKPSPKQRDISPPGWSSWPAPATGP